MITLLHLLSYAGGLAAFLFVTLSLASGLLWLAELIEEHSKYAKTVGIRSIYVIITLHSLLYITDSLPFFPLLFSIGAHLVYLQNFSSSWPYISLTSIKFLLSCVLVVADHFIWFFHFAAVAQDAKRYRPTKHRYNGGTTTNHGRDPPTFMDVAAFFAICVWFVPLFLFLSLSANDNVLPSLGGSTPPSPAGIEGTSLNTPGPIQPHRTITHKRSQPLMKSVLAPLVSILPRIRGRGRRGNAFPDEGLIAPRTPIRGSPIHSPVTMGMGATGSYFPWGTDESSTSMFSTNLTPESAAQHTRRSVSASRATPPPPRRVQSEAQISKSVNPRGIAMRNGIPAVSDAAFTSEPEGTGGEAAGIGSGMGGLRPKSPAMGLGPNGNEKIGSAEIFERPKKKAD